MFSATQRAKAYRNVNLPLSPESREALLAGRSQSLTAIVEAHVTEQLELSHMPVVQRPPRNTPRVCLSMDATIARRLHDLSVELEANVSDVVYSIMKMAMPAQPNATPKAHSLQARSSYSPSQQAA